MRPGRPSTRHLALPEAWQAQVVQLFRGTVPLLVARVTARAGSMVFLAIAARRYSPSDIGIYSFHLAFAVLITAFVDCGQATIAARELGKHDGSDSSRVLGPAMHVQLLLTLLMAVAGFILVSLPVAPSPAVLLLWAAAAIDAWILLLLVPSRVTASVGTLAVAEILRYWLPVVALGGWLWLGSPSIRPGSATTLFLFPLIGALTALGIVAARIARSELAGAWQSRSRLTTSMASGLPILAVTVILGLNNRLDVVMLRLLDGASAAGIYAAAYALVNALLMLPFLLSYLALPTYSRLMTQPEPDRSQAIDALWRTIGLLGVAAGCGLAIIGPRLLRPVFGEAFVPGSTVLVLMGSALPFVYVSNFFLNLLIASGNHRRVLRYISLATLANVALNAALIPRLSMTGAATATACAEILVLVLAASHVHRSLSSTLAPLRVVLALGVPAAGSLFGLALTPRLPGLLAASAAVGLAAAGSFAAGLLHGGSWQAARALVSRR